MNFLSFYHLITFTTFITFTTLPLLHARQAILSQYTGIVEVQPKNSTQWIKAKAKMILNQYEKIRTGKRSKATLLFEDGSRTMMSPDTTLSLSQLTAPINIDQAGGKTRNKVAKSGRGFALRTPTAVCSVRGTDFSVGITEKGDTQLDVKEGVVNGLKLATGESMDVGAGQSLNFTGDKAPLSEPQSTQEPGESVGAQQAKKEVGLDMTREQIQAAAAEEMKLAEYMEGKSLIDVNGNRVRVEEYILRKPKEVAEADRDKAFKFVVLNTRENRFDYFTYKGIFNKTLPDDLSVALKNVSGRVLGGEPEYYLRSYEMTQSNLTDAIKDMADGGHLVKVTYDVANDRYKLEAYSVGADGKAGTVTDTVNQNRVGNGKIYDPIADLYKDASASQDAIYDPLNDKLNVMGSADTLWRTVFNRYGHLMGKSADLASLTLDHVPAGTLTQPWFQYYSHKDGATHNIATLETYNNVGIVSNGNMTIRGRGVALIPDQNIGDAKYKYLNGNYAFDSYFPDSSNVDSPIMSENIHQRLITYYPKSASDIPYEQYDTYIFNDEGKIAAISAFANVTSGKAFKEELIKWNYEQVTKSSSFDDRKIDLVAEPKILIRSGLIK